MSKGVWIVSVWGLTVSGDVLIQNMLANIIFGHDTQILLFLLMLCIAQKTLLSGGVFGSVLKESECVLGCIETKYVCTNSYGS